MLSKKGGAKSSPVTLESLAQMIARGFESIDQRFESNDQRFDLIDKNFKAIGDRFDSIDYQLAHLDIRIGRVENDVQDIKNSMINRDEFDDLSARVKYLEMKMGIESGKD